MRFSRYFIFVLVALNAKANDKCESECNKDGVLDDYCYVNCLQTSEGTVSGTSSISSGGSPANIQSLQQTQQTQASAPVNISKCGDFKGFKKDKCEEAEGNFPKTQKEADLAEGLKACQEKTDQATKACDPTSSSSYSMGINFLDQATAMTSQINNQVGGACNATAKYLMGAQGSMAAYQLWCAGGYKRCSSACDDEIKKWTDLSRNPHPPTRELAQDQLSRLKPIKETCDKQQVFAQNAMKNVMQMGFQVFQLTMCQKAAKSADCTKNPNEPICQIGKIVDCSDPVAATSNLTCVCAGNPNDGRCTGAQYAGANGRKGGGFDSSSGGLEEGLGKVADFSGGHGESGSEGFNDASANKGNGVAMGGGPTGGGGGGGFGSGGGGGAPARGQQPTGQRGNSGFNTNINSGFNSGAGSGSRSSGGGWADGSGSVRGNGFGGPALPQDNKKLVDLKKYMPGGSLDPSRVLASMDKDGLTGPHTNIWNKVSLRYQNLQDGLRP